MRAMVFCLSSSEKGFMIENTVALDIADGIISSLDFVSVGTNCLLKTIPQYLRTVIVSATKNVPIFLTLFIVRLLLPIVHIKTDSVRSGELTPRFANAIK